MKCARFILEVLLVAAAAVGGWRFALRTEPLLRLSSEGGDIYYTTDDVATNVILVGSGSVLVALFILLARLEKQGTLTEERRRWILLALLAIVAFIFTFAGVIEFRYPA